MIDLEPLFQEESLDVVRSAAVCEKQIVPNETAVGRAGAVAEFAQNRVLLCGGRDHQVSGIEETAGACCCILAFQLQ